MNVRDGVRGEVRDKVRDDSPEMLLNKGFLTQKVMDERYLLPAYRENIPRAGKK